LKIYVCREYGPPANLQEIDINAPTPRSNELQVEISASGIGFVDGLMIQGLYQVKPPLPYYPGSEFVGVVSAIGDAVTHIQVGDRVLGTTNTGALGDLTCTSSRQCFVVPKNMSDAVAGGWFINYLTAIYGLQTCGDLQPKETVLILGAAGGVGSAAIAVAKAMGAHVIAAASTAEKRHAAMANGADETLDYSKDDWRKELKALTEKTGLDLVYDPVGGSATELALRSLAPDGRLLVVGFASGTIPKIPLNLALLKRCSIIGVDWGGDSRANPELNQPLMQTLFDWFEQGRLVPANVVERKLVDCREALTDQLAGNIAGKLVLTR
jgi:NADPH2:quinone reductase